MIKEWPTEALYKVGPWNEGAWAMYYVVWASLLGTQGEDRKTKPQEGGNMWMQRIPPEKARI